MEDLREYEEGQSSIKKRLETLTAQRLGSVYSRFGKTIKKNPRVIIDDTMSGIGFCDYESGNIKYNPAKFGEGRYSEDSIVKDEVLHWFDWDTGLHTSHSYSHLLHVALLEGEDKRRLGMAKCEEFNIAADCTVENIMALESRALDLLQKFQSNKEDTKITIELFFILSAINLIKEVYFARELASFSDMALVDFIKAREQAIANNTLTIYLTDGPAEETFSSMKKELIILEQVKTASRAKNATAK